MTDAGSQLREQARVLAVVLGSEPAAAAVPTSPRSVDRNRLADAERRRARTVILDPTGVLVAEHERWVERKCARRELHQVQVAAARAGAGHSDQHLAGLGLGHGDVAQLGLLQPTGEDERSHHEGVTEPARPASACVPIVRTVVFMMCLTNGRMSHQ